MSARLMLLILFISYNLYGYKAIIINHTPWQLKGRPTRAWRHMDDKVIEPYKTAEWDSGAALITGITLDLVLNKSTSVAEILTENYVGRAADVYYHVFVEPFVENKLIKKIKLLLVREPGGIGNALYPGGIVKISKEIDLNVITKPESRKPTA